MMVLNIHVHSMSHAKVAAFLLDSSVSFKFKCIKVLFTSNNSSYGLNTEPQPHRDLALKTLIPNVESTLLMHHRMHFNP